MKISANIGYIYNIILHKIEGIVIVNDDYFIYYTQDSKLNDLIYMIYNKHIVNSYIKEKDTNNFYFQKINLKNKSCLHGLSYILPFPYHIRMIACKLVELDENEIYNLFYSIKLEELMRDYQNEKISGK